MLRRAPALLGCPVCAPNMFNEAPPDVLRDWTPSVSSAARLLGQWVSRTITVSSGEAGDGWLWPMSS